MANDLRDRLQRAAAGAESPEDRAWAASKYRELFGAEPAQEGVPEMLKRTPLNPADAAMQRRQGSPTESEEPGLADYAMVAARQFPLGRLLLDPMAAARGFAQTASQGFADEAAGAARTLTNATSYPNMPAEHVPTAAGAEKEYEQGRDEWRAADRAAMNRSPELYTAGAVGGMLIPSPIRAATTTGRVLAAGAQGALASYGSSDKEGAGALKDAAGGALMASGLAGGAELIRGGVRAASPWIRRAADAEAQGRLPAAQALPPGREGIVRASERARDEILAADEAMTDAARAQYQAAVDPLLEAPGNLGPVRQQLLSGGVGSRTPGARANEAAAQRPATRVVARNRQVLDDLGDQPAVGDMLDVRRRLDADAGFGSPNPTSAQLAAREARGAVRAGIREASPGVAAADDAFTQFRRGQERRNDILFRSEEGGRAVQLSDEALEAMPAGMRQAMRVGDEIKAAAMLERLGDDSVEALRLAPYFDELRAQSPVFSEALEQLMAKKSLEATRLMTLSPQVRTNLSPAVAQLPFIGATASLAAQYGRGLGRQADRLAVPAMQAAAPRAPLSLSLLDAIMARREQDK